MELGLGNTLLAGDPRLIDHIVGEVKSQGIFDQFRKECIADVDTKPAYQNLRTRVESSVNSFLSKQTWRADLNKNQLRETLRKHIHEAPYLEAGVERIVDQVVNPKVYSVFMPQIEDVVYKFLGLERPKNRQINGPCGFKDLLPKDLDPVSPESDKNSLRDVSLDSVDANIDDTNVREPEITPFSSEKNVKNDNDQEKHCSKNGHTNENEKSSDETTKIAGNVVSNVNLNNSGKSEEKGDEEEEDSPMFEPIDIMNLNESNISNDSHLSGISELTSHRSRSPDFSDDTSRDNMDFSNQDSQFSKVSSDSRLSIVTDFGSSNHASTPLSDVPKDDKDRGEVRSTNDHFKAVREFEIVKDNKDVRSNNEMNEEKGKRRSFSSKETSRDGTESGKDCRDYKEKSRDGESSRSKIPKDTRKERDIGKKSTTQSAEIKNEKNKRIKEKSELSRDSGEKSKDTLIRAKDEKVREPERKDVSVGKEVKDLKDIYKEKIRELREKKELTEKEKLSKDTGSMTCLRTKEKRDSSRENRKETKDYKTTSKSNYSSRSESKASKTEPKSSRSESRDKGKRDDRKYSRDHKSKINIQVSSDTSDVIEGKRLSRSEKDDKIDKTDLKQDPKEKTTVKSSRSDTKKSMESKRDSKGEIEVKEKKRRDDKKNKIKDDHSSLRKNSDDRRSTDRDGSNGSNGKSSQKNNPSSSATTGKPVTANLSKESTTTSNASSETSDSIEEKQNEKLRITIDQKNVQIVRTTKGMNFSSDGESQPKTMDIRQNEISLPIKKRPLFNEESTGEVTMKKPKFAKNFQEAKRLMKIRRRIEKEKAKRQLEIDRNNESNSPIEPTQKIDSKNDLESVPDEERVQIIEVRDEEYDEPYPEIQSDFTPEERSLIILGGESIFTSALLAKRFNGKSTLSEMELSIRQSLKEMISDNKIEETNDASIKPQKLMETDSETKNEIIDSNEPNLIAMVTKDSSNDRENLSNFNKDIESSSSVSEITKSLIDTARVMDTKHFQGENCTRDEGMLCKFENVEIYEPSKNIENVESTSVKSSEFDERHELEIVDEKFEIDEIIREKSNCNDFVEGKAKINEIDEVEARITDIVGGKANIEGIDKEKTKISETVAEKVNINEIVDEKAEVHDIVEEKANITENVEERSNIDEIVEETAEINEIAGKSDITEFVEEKIIINEIFSESSHIEARCVETNDNITPSITMELKEKTDKSFIRENEELSCDRSETNSQNSAPITDENLSCLSDDEGPCLYLIADNERLERFAKFMKSFENEESSIEEQSVEMISNEIVSSLSRPMAPPKPKRKYSTSPLTDILLNNANNNNEAHKIIDPIADVEDVADSLKKRKIGRPKKQRINAGLCNQQNLPNGENFVMPLSPESDVSATSEKIPSNPLKDEKSRPRGSNQRYTSDDLYKPRPLFSSSSRRSRRSNQA